MMKSNVPFSTRISVSFCPSLMRDDDGAHDIILLVIVDMWTLTSTISSLHYHVYGLSQAARLAVRRALDEETD